MKLICGNTFFFITKFIFVSGLIWNSFSLNAQTKTVPAKAKAEVPDTVKNSLEKALDVFMADPDLKNASFSFLAKEIKTGTVIGEYNPDMSLVPASTMKAITTASALEILGGGYKFKTIVQYTGYIDSNCVLHGDIYIKGGGDPALGSRFYTEHYFEPYFIDVWSDAVIQTGIDSITGNIIADAELYGWDPTPVTWSYGDLGNYFGASPSALTVFDNTCYLNFKSGGKAGDSTELVCVEPFIPELQFINQVKSANSEDDNSLIIGPMYQFDRLIRGTIPKNEENYKVRGSIPDPAEQVAFELKMSLQRRGLKMRSEALTVRELKLNNKYIELERKDIYTQYSPSVSSIVYWTNLVSMNLFAEHLMNQIGLVKYGNATTGSGTAAVTDFWSRRGIDTKGLYINDGSGLSRHDAVSARHLTDIMAYMSKTSKSGTTFENSLPIAGKTGTLSKVAKGTSAAGNLRAKSGTMSRVKSYSGYVTTKSGKKLAFTMIVNNFNCSTSQLVKKLEKIMVAMSDFRE